MHDEQRVHMGVDHGLGKSGHTIYDVNRRFLLRAGNAVPKSTHIDKVAEGWSDFLHGQLKPRSPRHKVLTGRFPTLRLNPEVYEARVMSAMRSCTGVDRLSKPVARPAQDAYVCG